MFSAYVFGSITGVKLRNPEVLRIAIAAQYSSRNADSVDSVIRSSIESEIHKLDAALIKLEPLDAHGAPSSAYRDIKLIKKECANFLESGHWQNWKRNRHDKDIYLRQRPDGRYDIIYPMTICALEFELTYIIGPGNTFTSQPFSPY